LNLVFYLGITAILGFVHLLNLLININAPFPLFLSTFIIFLIVFILHKKTIFYIYSIGLRWNLFAWILQGLLCSIYFFVQSPFGNIVLLLVFIGIEILRIRISNLIYKQNKEIEGFEEQREQLNETFRIVRAERHDFLKHISALHFMLENDQKEEAQDYLEKLVDGYEETNLSIKGERGSVAGILHQMYRKAKSIGIEVIYDLDVPLSTLPLSDKDIVTLIGNLLSNSIDACETWQNEREKQAHITLQFYKRSGLFLLVCKNESLPIPTPILDELYQSYGKTTKGEGHEGLGTKLIQEVVTNCQGYLDFVHKDEEFSVKIKIPAIK
jgi:two-component system, LytTR family, sensor histidine kinase NatK